MGSSVIAKTENVTKIYEIGGTWLHKRRKVRAVDGVDLQIKQGDVVALVGESGCGKTTLGKLFALLEIPTMGKVIFRGTDLAQLKRGKRKSFRKSLQMIFQDPYSSLDPRYNVESSISEVLVIHQIGQSKDERYEMVCDALGKVELIPQEDFLYKYPHELSGGQLQRVALARSIALQPQLIVADEPVSMLDVSVRAEVLNLMLKFNKDFNTSYLFITHDLSVARYVSNSMAVMYLGQIVEMGPTEEIIHNCLHPYTQLLLSAVPIPDPAQKRKKLRFVGDVPDPGYQPEGCRFHQRCSLVQEICKSSCPQLVEVKSNHFLACHLSKHA